MAWCKARNLAGLEYTFTDTEYCSNAYFIFRTSSRRKKKQPVGKPCSEPCTYRMAPAAATWIIVECFKPSSCSASGRDMYRASSVSRAAIHLVSDSRLIQHSVRVPSL